ncbi:MAG: hypothetical protein UMV23_03980 [Halanaerobium sp.]|nr:hypothetical protein [Halanaerobium sp.]
MSIILYFSGFLAAALIQASVIYFAESLGFTSLGVALTINRLVWHILAGEVVGFAYLFLARNSKMVQDWSVWIQGLVLGGIYWSIALPAGIITGAIKSNAILGMPTFLFTLTAFILYGLVTASTIRNALFIWST